MSVGWKSYKYIESVNLLGGGGELTAARGNKVVDLQLLVVMKSYGFKSL